VPITTGKYAIWEWREVFVSSNTTQTKHPHHKSIMQSSATPLQRQAHLAQIHSHSTRASRRATTAAVLVSVLGWTQPPLRHQDGTGRAPSSESSSVRGGSGLRRGCRSRAP